MKGVTTLFYSFLEHLQMQKEKIALLQLIGKLEDYLVKEFCYHTYKKSEGKVFALVNFYKEGEQRIDICLFRGKNLENIEIYGMIEAKYLRNRHRLWHYDAKDEITTTLNKFRNQLHVFEEKTHGGYNVNLLSKTNEIYGLIFASYVSENKDKQLKNNFYDTILEKANESFRYHDLSKPYFRMAYDDEEIKVLNSIFYNTLKIGLWKIITPPKGT